MNQENAAAATSPSLEARLAKRFHIPGAPTLQARPAPSAPPIIVSRIRNDRPQLCRSLAPRPEEAFAFQIPLIPSAYPDLRYAHRPVVSEGMCEPGRIYLLDMSAHPTVRLDTAFDNLRFYISQSTIDELAYDKGLRRVGGLAQPTVGEPDPIMFHLAQTLVPVLERPELASALFLDHLAIALHEHVVTAYGGVSASGRRRGAGLASWRMRRVQDFVEANLAANPSISDLAREYDLSASHFTQAFRQTMGMSPHQWCLRRRVERAKVMLLNTESSLATIASSCGFFDQSHFSRVFARIENCSPSAWRRRHRSRLP